MTTAAYGVREQTKTRSLVESYAEQVRISGFAVVDTTLSAEFLERLRRSLDEMVLRWEREAGGRQALADIGEADTVRAPLADDPAFLEVATQEAVLEVVRVLLGDYFILLQQNGILNRPGDPHRQGAYHRDLPYQHLVTSRPLAVSALLCLDPFMPDTGGTYVLPGSHRTEAFPSEGYVERMAHPISARAGSYILLDSMLFHAAGVNRSPAVRRAINTMYGLPILKQQIVLPAALGGRWRDDEFLARFLGYKSDPPRSVREYLANRRARAARTP